MMDVSILNIKCELAPERWELLLHSTSIAWIQNNYPPLSGIH